MNEWWQKLFWVTWDVIQKPTLYFPGPKSACDCTQEVGNKMNKIHSVLTHEEVNTFFSDVFPIPGLILGAGIFESALSLPTVRWEREESRQINYTNCFSKMLASPNYGCTPKYVCISPSCELPEGKDPAMYASIFLAQVPVLMFKWMFNEKTKPNQKSGFGCREGFLEGDV